jgi:hypothetical protein
MCTPSSHRIGGPIMNLISRTHHSCERQEYVFIVLQDYKIITIYIYIYIYIYPRISIASSV